MLHNFPRSVFARRPGLLLEKVRQRLFGAPVLEFSSHAPVYSRDAFKALCDLMRVWAAACKPVAEPVPETRVFGQEFPLEDLLAACRNGPADSTGLRGDIKWVWEFSRAHALPLNALILPPHVAAARAATFLRAWREANADPGGPAWTCAMEVAIRAVNWILADALTGGRLARELGDLEWRRAIWNHGYVIRRRLETRLVGSNHYVANLLGLAFVGSCFPEDPAARAWVALADREMPKAILSQTYPDGGLYEASLPYHALVLEMALWFSALAGSASWMEPARQRLRAMAQCMVDMTRSDGTLYTVGDDDSGRIIALDRPFSGAPRGKALRRLAEQVLNIRLTPAGDALYPDSGWWVCRNKQTDVHLAFGGVGMAGLGAHAHNDTLSFCLDLAGHPVVVDPGSYLYTPDPEARNRYRSAFSHNGIMLDYQEPRTLPSGGGDALFRLPGPVRTATVRTREPRRLMVETRLPNAAGGMVAVRRDVTLEEAGVLIDDEILAEGNLSAGWFFHLAPAVRASLEGGGVTLRLPDDTRHILRGDLAAITWSLEPYDFAPGYGRRESATQIRAVLSARGPVRVRWTLTPAAPATP